MHPIRRIFESLTRPHYLYRPHQLFLRAFRTAISYVNVEEHVGRSVWLHGLYAPIVSEALWRLTDKGTVAVDAGANIGHMTSIMALRTGSSGAVLAAEPHPAVFPMLQRNLRLFESHADLAPVKVLDQALSNHNGSVLLTWDDRFARNRGTAQIGDQGLYQVNVQSRRLDDMLTDHLISVLKLDVEGHELEVLQGCCRLFRKKRIMNVVYECHTGPNSHVHAFLEAHNFTIYRLSWKRRGPILLPPSQRPSAFPYFDYLATRTPNEARHRFAPRGWRVLQTRY